MYSKQDASRITEEFWTAFGKYMALHRSSGGEKVNWINYKTGIKGIQFRMEVDKKSASIGVFLLQNGKEDKYYEVLANCREMLEAALNGAWEWKKLPTERSAGKYTVGLTMHGVNVMNKSDWPDIISFLKPRIIALDLFWSDAKPAFEMIG